MAIGVCVPGAAWPVQHRAIDAPKRDCRSFATSPKSLDAGNGLLSWITESHPAIKPTTLKVHCADAGSAGWGLVATEHLRPGETILSVPLPACITSEGAHEDSWSIHMAGQIIEQVPLGKDAPLAPWIDALPRHIPLPWVYWTQAEVAELQDIDTIEEAERLRDVLQRAYDAFPDHPRDRVAWALSVIHSRSFVAQDQLHVWVPGVDLCNHKVPPSAGVRFTHSPDACQGSLATEEIAPPQKIGPSCFELVVGDRGIAPGQEITISYGAWPNDVLLLFFGWVDEANPHDAVCLFSDLLELNTFHQRMVMGAIQDDDVAVHKTAHSLSASKTEIQRMVVTLEGVDRRLIDAAEAVLRSHKMPNGFPPPSLSEFLRERCKEVLARYPTSAAEDEALLRSTPFDNIPLRTAIRYRLAKKATLSTVLQSLGSIGV